MEVVPVMITAISLVVSYFSGPMLNFRRLPRVTCRSFKSVKRGNFWGLPVNFPGVFAGDGCHDRGDAAGLRPVDHRPRGNGRTYRPADRGDPGRVDVHHRGLSASTSWRISFRRRLISRNVAPRLISWRMGGNDGRGGIDLHYPRGTSSTTLQ